MRAASSRWAGFVALFGGGGKEGWGGKTVSSPGPTIPFYYFGVEAVAAASI
jgi:hypothetical protein